MFESAKLLQMGVGLAQGHVALLKQADAVLGTYTASVLRRPFVDKRVQSESDIEVLNYLLCLGSSQR